MNDPDFYPDGLTSEAISAVQREVDRELRGEGYPVEYGKRPTARRPVRDPVEPGSATPLSSASSLPGVHGRSGGHGAADGIRPPADQLAGDPARILFTPAQAAELLQVRESWLRRRAARRRVPCTFLGKHLRFSRSNVEQIAADGARPAAAARATDPGTGAHPRRPARPHGRARAGSRRPGGGQGTNSSRG